MDPAAAPLTRALTVAALAFLVVGASGDEAKERVVLQRAITEQALPLMVSADYLGLGAEAGQLGEWARDHRRPLILRPRDLSVEDAERRRMTVSRRMVVTLERLGQWYSLTAPSDRPISHEQLKAATLAPASIERIRGIFEGAIRRGVRAAGKWLTPETGGEATLDKELRLVEAPDPRWATIQNLVKVSNDPGALSALAESRAFEIAQVDTHGLLKVAVARFRLGQAAATEMRRAVTTVVENATPTYTHDPAEQFALIAGRDWQGRYVGRWHTHGPHEHGGDWVGGDLPSFEDMQNSVRDGQYLTVSFEPDGFDLYDASALSDEGRVDLSLLKIIRYRSPSWRNHFRRLRPEPNAKRPPG